MNSSKFIYLDWNATAPLELSVRKAMEGAFDLFGNPSSVHLEGRKAKRILEESRDVISDCLDVPSGRVIFTSGATEAAQLVLAIKKCKSAKIEHPAILRLTDSSLGIDSCYQVERNFSYNSAVQLANSETGILQKKLDDVWLTDATQYFPKCDFKFSSIGAHSAILAPHKFGGPKGIGAILARDALYDSLIRYAGSQEDGIRPGTENIIAIAGFAEAVKVAKKYREAGVWEHIKMLRDLFEAEIELRSPGSNIVGQGLDRLPNTSCVLTPGWSGEKQVISMDLAGFGISYGSACSQTISKPPMGLMQLGYSEYEASCSVRISLGPSTSKTDMEKFVEAWGRNLTKQSLNAA